MIIDNNNLLLNADPLLYLSGITVFVILASIRYTDAFLSAVSFALIIVMNAFLLLKFGAAGKLILPFDTMLVSWLFYTSFHKMASNDKFRYWSRCIVTVEALCVVTFCLAGNYLVVRQLNEMLLGATYAHGSDIAYSYFFYVFTIVTPLILIATGLVKKDYILIRAGIVLEAAGILSIKYYYSFMPVEIALILAGVIVVLISWFCIRYLKKPRLGFTLDDSADRDPEATDLIRSAIVAQATAQLNMEQKSSSFKGGNSGGGGASGEY
jgi:hypothetical protein